MSRNSLKEFKEKGSVIGLAASVTVLLEYQRKAVIFEEKAKALNESMGGDFKWQ
jgi:hypothetical protein